jgi:AcrR family transcriptional regulator
MSSEAAADSGCNGPAARQAPIRGNQRRRLERAVLEAVPRKGFAGTTVADLVTSAGVSKGTLYEIFGSKEECFLASFDAVAAEAVRSVCAVCRTSQTREVRLSAALHRIVDLVEEYPAAASLVLVDSLSIGRRGVERREHLGAAFEALLAESFKGELATRVFVSGVRRVTYGHLRRGEPARLSDHVGELLDWAFSYGSRRLAGPPATSGTAITSESRQVEIPWGEPPGSERSRTKLTQRERIMRAAAQIAAAEGASCLTIPAISAASGTSNQTFYEHFESKDQAFLAAFDELARIAHWKASTVAANEASDWTTRIVGYLRALLEHIATEPLFAKVAFIEMPTKGPGALDRADEVTGRFTSFLEPIGLPEGAEPLPPTVVAAIGGGLRGAIQHEVATGALQALPEKAGTLAAITLAPFELGDTPAIRRFLPLDPYRHKG